MNEKQTIDSRKRVLAGFWQWLLIIISAVIVIFVINQIFFLNLFGPILGMESSYLYILVSLYVSTVFLIYPIRNSEHPKKKRYFYFDFFLFLLTLFTGFLFAFKGLDIYFEGWMMISPMPYTVFGFFFWILIIEATRRSQGPVIATLISLFSVYPLFAEHMPGFLSGIGFNVVQTMNYHVFSVESLIGLPMRVTGELIIGFMIFGMTLVTTGGGPFFMEFALSLLGSTRGGAAKVAVFSSSLFGTMSGSALSNVVTTGSVTIPAMIRTGYPPYFAGAVESCASTGGVLMPPVMGATAFLLAEFLAIPYLHVAIAASIPSLLYYFGLLIQVDAHAARNNLRGLAREELPSLKNTLKKGWYYIGALFVLVFFLYLRVESRAPFYATIFLLICSNFRKETRFNLAKVKNFFYDHIQTLAGLIAIISGIGMIIGSLSVTGVAHGLSREIIYFSGGNVFLLVLLSAVTSFILGMGVTITAVYVLVAITLAPSLIQMGLDPLAVNLFLLYCAMLSLITLPVATAVFTAAALSGATVLKTGLTAMRLGIVTYIVPFFFIFNPALILKGPVVKVVQCTLTAAFGILLIASTLGGYFAGIGNITSVRKFEKFTLIPGLFISGLLLTVPEPWTDLVGLVMGVGIILILSYPKVFKKRSSRV